MFTSFSHTVTISELALFMTVYTHSLCEFIYVLFALYLRVHVFFMSSIHSYHLSVPSSAKFPEVLDGGILFRMGWSNVSNSLPSV